AALHPHLCSQFLCGWKDTSTKKNSRQRNYRPGDHLFSRVVDFGKVTAKKIFQVLRIWCKVNEIRHNSADQQHQAALSQSTFMQLRRGSQAGSKPGFRLPDLLRWLRILSLRTVLHLPRVLDEHHRLPDVVV